MVLVGDFNETELKKGVDKKALAKVKKETGLNYANTKIIKKKGAMFLRVWACTAEEFDPWN